MTRTAKNRTSGPITARPGEPDSAVHGLIEQARRCIFFNHLVSQAANALCAALLAVIVLLVAGADILGWRWLLAVPAATLGLGVWRAWLQVPSAYGAAQLVDRQLGTADSLSTAVHFEKPGAAGSDSMRAGQRRRAEALAAHADVRRAVPFLMPRASYATAALALIATSLFAVRYGAQHRLDLRTPLARILGLQLSFDRPAEEARKTAPPPEAQPPDDDEDSSAAAAAAEKGRPHNAKSKPEQAGSKASEASRKKTGRNSGQEGEERQQKQQQQRDGEQQQSDEQAQAESRPQEAGKSRDSSGQQGKDGGKQQQGKQDAQQQEQSNGSNSSLMAKVKDAVQNLLSKMNPRQNSSEARKNQQQAGKERNQQQQQQQQAGGQQQASQKGNQGSGQQQQGESQATQNGQQARNGEKPAGQGQGKSDSNQATKQPGSGIGSQDGAKDIREAQQLAAMGKISEILGKRAATITGDATVEVESTSQQLSTPYSQRNAAHSETAAEIGRDEIPVALESYVARYFEQVRRQAPKK